MSESARIEKVEGANVHHLIHLIGLLADFENLAPPDAEAMERLARDATTDRKLFDASIALVGDRAVGYVTYYFTYSTFLARPTLFLEDIFVIEEYRKKGVGRDLFRYCVNEARTTLREDGMGCAHLEQRCHRFLRETGWEKDRLVPIQT